MLLFHVSPSVNRQSIGRAGLSLLFARGRVRRIWVCTQMKTSWACDHVEKRHNCHGDPLDVYAVSVPRGRLTRTKWRGVWTLDQDIPTECVGLILTTADRLEPTAPKGA